MMPWVALSIRRRSAACLAILFVVACCLAPTDGAVEGKDQKQHPLRNFFSKLKDILQTKLRKNRPPQPIVIDDFLTSHEASYLLTRYEYLMKDSRSVGYTTKSRNQASQSNYRTSRSVRLPPLGDSIVFDIEKRAADLAGLNHSYVEDLQMACYEVGELHGLHRDDAEGKVNADRAATVLVYLRAPSAGDDDDDGDDSKGRVGEGEGDGGKGGGETLFTNRPIEDERDLATRKPLNTEQGALDLFIHYCDNPKKNMVSVSPKVGRAVTWRNWLGDDFDTFATSSTHGSCPVKIGSKCVIQQWIGRTNKNPLRDERVAALFLAGADINYLPDEDGDGQADARGEVLPPCLIDASAKEGKVLMQLCTGDAASAAAVQVEQRPDGPYGGVGSLRLYNGGLKTDLPADLVQGEGVTVSFWVRGMKPNRRILSLGEDVSLTYVERGEIKQIFELRADNATEEIKVYSTVSSFSEQWYWVSVAFLRGSRVSASIYSNGQLDGTASMDLDETCGVEGEEEDVKLLILEAPRDDEGTRSNTDAAALADGSDVSFVVVHQGFLDDPREVLKLGQQAKRYDKNS